MYIFLDVYKYKYIYIYTCVLLYHEYDQKEMLDKVSDSAEINYSNSEHSFTMLPKRMRNFTEEPSELSTPFCAPMLKHKSCSFFEDLVQDPP